MDVRVGVVVLTCRGTLDSSGCQSGCCCTSPVVELWTVVDVRVGVVVLTCCGTLDSSGCQSGCCCTHLSWNS